MFKRMSFTVKKTDGKLVFNDLGGPSSRNPSTIWCIEQADKIYKWVDFKELTIHTLDYESTSNDYTYSKQNHYTKLVPSFDFHAWSEMGIDNYDTFTKNIDSAGLKQYEIDKVGWIGSLSHPNRVTLLEIGTNNPHLFDIFDCGHWGFKYRQTNPNPNSKYNCDKYISTPDLVKTYSILIDIEGEGFSARTKHLMWSNRPLLLQDRPHKEFFYEHLIEWEHYIPIKRDLSDLIEKTQWCLNNYSIALEIAENAYQFAKTHLTREACYKQWNKIISDHIV